MIVDAADGYLTATRLEHDPTLVSDETTRRCQALFETIVFALDHDGDSHHPKLMVVDTANAKVENLVLDGADIVVHDVALRREFLVLTGAILNRIPPAPVIAWAQSRLSVALTSLGAIWPALCAHHLSQRESPATFLDPIATNVQEVRQSVAVQEYFVVAHECVHSALRHGSLSHELVRAATALVHDAVDAAESTRSAPTIDDVVAAVVRDEVAAINAGSELFQISAEEERSLYERRSREYPLPAYVGSWVKERPHLIEEMICDFIATDLTLADFTGAGMEPLPILNAILLGFHNHGVLESIRDLGWRVANGSRNAEFSDVLVSRTAVWRTAAPDVWGRCRCIDPDVMRRSFSEVTDDASGVVGDHIRFTLAADFPAQLSRTTAPPEIPFDLVVGLVLEAWHEERTLTAGD